MNKKRIVILLLAAASQLAVGSTSSTDACSSHQFTPRQITTDLVYIDGLGTFYDRHHREKDKWLTYTGELLYQRSKKSSQLGSAFLLGNGKNQVSVSSDGPADIDAAWIFGPQVFQAGPDDAGDFDGTLSIQPQRTVYGYHGNWYFNLENWWCGLWADISSAILNVHHSLHVNETDIEPLTPTCPNSNIIDALSGSRVGPLAYPQVGVNTSGITGGYIDGTLRYSKFYGNLCNRDKRRTGIDDIQLRLGYDYKWCNENVVGLYAIGTIPAGRNPTNEFIFEPLVGSKHGSVGAGLVGDYDLWCNNCGNMSVTLMTDLNYRFVFKHDECRTFDLTNGPMTRYLLVSLNPGAAPAGALVNAYPAANFLTQSVSVKPRSTIQWWAAANFEYCKWDFEVGYNLFWRQSEEISGVTAPCVPVGILDINPIISGHTALISMSNANIGTYPTGSNFDNTFTPITLAKINVSSAEAARVFTNKVYAGFSWDGDFCDCVDWMAGLGGSYEFVSGDNRCGALPFWAVFGKAALSF